MNSRVFTRTAAVTEANLQCTALQELRGNLGEAYRTSLLSVQTPSSEQRKQVQYPSQTHLALPALRGLLGCIVRAISKNLYKPMPSTK